MDAASVLVEKPTALYCAVSRSSINGMYISLLNILGPHRVTQDPSTPLNRQDRKNMG